jgi:hypothetical protein
MSSMLVWLAVSISASSSPSFSELTSLPRSEIENVLDLIEDPSIYLKSPDFQTYGILFICFEANKQNRKKLQRNQKIFNLLGTERNFLLSDGSSFLTQEGRLFLEDVLTRECGLCLESDDTRKYSFLSNICDDCIKKYVENELINLKNVILHPIKRTPLTETEIQAIDFRAKFKNLFFRQDTLNTRISVGAAVIRGFYNLCGDSSEIFVASIILAMIIFINGCHFKLPYTLIGVVIIIMQLILGIGFGAYQYLSA